MTPEEITALFADVATKFTPIAGNPTDDDLTELRDVLYPILLDIPYDEDGNHNLIGLIEPTVSYTSTWGAAFPIPTRPAAYDPNIAADATPVVRARMEAAHNVRLRDYATFAAAERATAKFIRDAVDELWYKDLKHARSFYTNVTAKQLLDHLNDNCGGLHPSELVNLPTDMISYYAQADGIPKYINMMEEAQRKLARASLPMSDDQLLAIASTAVLASQHFPRTTDEWEARPRANKTWAAWKTTYRAAHIARKRQLLASGSTSMDTPGRAHVVTTDASLVTPDTFERLDGYLNNLANAATQERTTLTQLVENNASLTASVATLTASVAALTAAYTLLSKGHAPAVMTAPVASGSARTRPPRLQQFAVNGYCWTHGYKVGKTHSSATCTARAVGHKVTATRANTMGGSSLNKGWDAT